MIESYSFGNIVIDGRGYNADCIVTQSYVNGDWWRKNGHKLAVEDIKEAIEKEKPEVVVIGTGKYGFMKILKETVDYLNSLGIELHSGNTDGAVKIYNEISANNKVVGFFHLTC
ncbi:MAG: hypothetical protein E3J87_08070 [Candidatus Cloacimonadota bacterium]|nr:MAG: hypothetical protein E3J87_08070 [Candidatus Cloacimonadota bacterium]